MLIKTSWGGKSLNYNFRPPSLPDFKTTPEYEEAKAKANENLKRYEAAVAAAEVTAVPVPTKPAASPKKKKRKVMKAKGSRGTASKRRKKPGRKPGRGGGKLCLIGWVRGVVLDQPLVALDRFGVVSAFHGQLGKVSPRRFMGGVELEGFVELFS